MTVSAVGGLPSDRPFIEPNRPASQTPAIQITGATLVSAASRPASLLLSQPSAQKPATSTTVDAPPAVRAGEMPGTTSPVKSSVEKLTSCESVDVHQTPGHRP